MGKWLQKFSLKHDASPADSFDIVTVSIVAEQDITVSVQIAYSILIDFGKR